MHRTYGAKDEQDAPIGDMGFLGVDERGDPRRLAPGMAASAVNKDFSDGTAATRLGWMTPVWGGLLGVSFDPDYDGEEEGLNFDPDGDGTEEGISFEPCGLNTTYGHLVFSDPYGNEALLVATAAGVWRLRNYAEPELIRLPDKERISYPVCMIQCFDRVLMLRGTDRSVLEWNPAGDFEEGIGEFEEITQTSEGTFTETIPNADYGFVFGNRAWVLQDRDTLAASDILDYTRWDSTLNNLRINAGTDDAILAGVPGKDNRILVCKRRSFYVLDGVYGENLGFTATAQEVTRERGLIGRQAIVDVGGGEWAYLSDGNIYTIGMTAENKLRSSPAPLSWPMKALMERVHWPYAGNAILQVHEERLYAAVPIDGATGNNALLVYNLTTKKWEGYWTADYLRVVGLPIVTEHGQKRLCILNGTGETFDASWVKELDAPDAQDSIALSGAVHGVADGALLVVGEGFADFLYGWTAWIEDELVTRGYGLQTLQQGKQLRLTLDQSTWNPRFSVFARRGGVAGETTVAGNVRRGFERNLDVVSDNAVQLVPGTGWVAVTTGNGYRRSYILDNPGTLGYLIWEGVVSNTATTAGRAYLVGPAGQVYITVPANTPATTVVVRLPLWGLVFGEIRTYGDPSPEWDPGVGTSYGVVYYETAIEGAMYHSRRQQIYSAPQVLWEEGAAPLDIEAKGYDDYAWRLGTGIPEGVTLGRMQRQAEVYRVQKRGDLVQARIANERGRLVVHGVQVDGITGRRGGRGRIA